MITPSAISHTGSQLPIVNNDSGTVQNSTADIKSGGKAATSISNKPQFADDKHYNANPVGSPSGQARLPRLTRCNATLNNASLQGVAIDKSNRANPILEYPETLPLRLLEKIDAVDVPKLQKLNSTLHKHAESTIDDLIKGIPAHGQTHRLDVELLPLFAEAENSRNPELNLHTFKSAEECREAIRAAQEDVQNSNKPSSMRVIYPPFKLPNHHIALDVQLKPNQKPSIAGFESALGNLAETLLESLKHNFPGSPLKIVASGTQPSQWDCVMFSLSNALKAHKHKDGFTALLHNSEHKAPTIITYTEHFNIEDDHEGANTSKNKASSQSANISLNAKISQDVEVIPVDFLKHSQTNRRIRHSPRKYDVVTKDKEGPHKETLEHRNLAYRTRFSERVYSTSIDGFRLQEIKRAGEHLAAQGVSTQPTEDGSM